MTENEKVIVEDELDEILSLLRSTVTLLAAERNENAEKQKTFRMVAISIIAALCIVMSVTFYSFLENAFADQTTVDVKVDKKAKIQKGVTDVWLVTKITKPTKIPKIVKPGGTVTRKTTINGRTTKTKTVK